MKEKRMTATANGAQQRFPLRLSLLDAARSRPHHQAARPLFPLAVALLSACSDNGATGPGSSSVCGGTLVSLGVLQSATLDCSNGGTTITLAGRGASYLVVPQFAAGGVPNQAVGYSIGVSGGSVLTASVHGGLSETEQRGTQTLGAWAQGGARVSPGLLQRQFDAILRG